MKKEMGSKEMRSAVEIYNEKFDKKAKYLKEALLEKAKQLIMEQLNSSNLEIVRNPNILEDDYTYIKVTISRPPQFDNEGNTVRSGIGDFSTWYILYYCNKTAFPKEELNEWLKQFGWQFEADDTYYTQRYEIRLKSFAFSTNALSSTYWKEIRNLPDYI